MPVLWKAKQPYNVNVAASTAAIASLMDLDYLTSIVDLLKAERLRLFNQLCQVPFLRPLPSQANFILCQVLSPFTALEIKTHLIDQGILVRYYNTPLLQDYIRISVGKPEHTDRLIAALAQLSNLEEPA